MIEKQLQEVLECKPYIPVNWAAVLDNVKKGDEAPSFDSCWSTLIEELSSYEGLQLFWSSIGFDSNEDIKEFLNLFKNPTMLTAMYWGLDYIYKAESKPERLTPKYIDCVYKEDQLFYKQNIDNRKTFYTILEDFVYNKIIKPAKKTVGNSEYFKVHIKNEITDYDVRAVGTVNPELIHQRDLKYLQNKKDTPSEENNVSAYC